MKRREFLTWVGLGAVAASLPVALAACNTSGSTEPETTAEGTTSEPETSGSPEVAQGSDYTPVGTVADLDAQGFIADEAFAAGPIMVIRDPANAEAIIAVDPRCTHRGCNVEWNSQEAAFICPCHDSVFSPDGRVESGPATAPLAKFDAKIDGDQVVVSAGS
jgi:cytochrome b6-f complex iron-sulfur subunit